MGILIYGFLAFFVIMCIYAIIQGIIEIFRGTFFNTEDFLDAIIFYKWLTLSDNDYDKKHNNTSNHQHNYYDDTFK